MFERVGELPGGYELTADTLKDGLISEANNLDLLPLVLIACEKTSLIAAILLLLILE